MSSNPLSRGDLKAKIIVRLVIVVPALLVLFFLPAGTFDYWEAWVYIAILLIPMLFVISYLFRNEPELVERRMRMREKQREQKTIIKVSYPIFLLAFILPGLDRRFEWSTVPVALVIVSDLLVLLGYSLIFLVFKENPFASRIVEVETEQKVITSGPYAFVRHPMYAGAILMYSFSPLALGSWWALIPALGIIPLLVVRIWNEEAVLASGLEGYRDYMQKTKYRLIPGVW